MPTLRNPRHEAFAQELARGKTAVEAYELAGYAPGRFNASRLKTNDNICARLAELQGQAAERAVVTTESLIAEADRLMRRRTAAGLRLAHGLHELRHHRRGRAAELAGAPGLNAE